MACTPLFDGHSLDANDNSMHLSMHIEPCSDVHANHAVTRLIEVESVMC